MGRQVVVVPRVGITSPEKSGRASATGAATRSREWRREPARAARGRRARAGAGRWRRYRRRACAGAPSWSAGRSAGPAPRTGPRGPRGPALDLRVKQAGDRTPDKHVWHCSVRAAPEDRTLSDEDWAVIARRVLNATGIAPAGDPDACRWVAVRHAEDHIPTRNSPPSRRSTACGSSSVATAPPTYAATRSPSRATPTPRASRSGSPAPPSPPTSPRGRGPRRTHPPRNGRPRRRRPLRARGCCSAPATLTIGAPPQPAAAATPEPPHHRPKITELDHGSPCAVHGATPGPLRWFEGSSVMNTCARGLRF